MFSPCSRFLAAGSVLAAVFFGALEARATSMVKFSDEDLSHIADAIVIASVESVEPQLRYGARVGKITTLNTVKVIDSWKGGHAVGDSIRIREIGGVVGKEMATVEGTAGFLKGERVLLFLHYRAASNEYGLVGWSQGKFTLLANANGGWDVAKHHLDVASWGSSFSDATIENRAFRGGDLVSLATRVKRVVAADAAANVNWRDLPQYRGISGKGAKE